MTSKGRVSRANEFCKRFYNEYPSLGSSLLTIGMFDGVHRGHQQLLHTLVDHAHSLRLKAVVLTFTTHPAHLFGRLKPAIMTLEHRLRLIEETGVDDILVFDFTKRFASQTAEEFLHTLKKHIDLKALLLGYDGKIGSDRKKSNFTDTELITIPPFSIDGHLVSSSRVREAIIEGDFKTLSQLLGRPYSILSSLNASQLDVTGLQLPPKGDYELLVKQGKRKYERKGHIKYHKLIIDDLKDRPIVEAEFRDAPLSLKRN